MKRAFIIHGWKGWPEMAWFPWLKRELESRDFDVTIPQMPNPDTPMINVWVPHLANVISSPNSETFLIGHSMGVQTVLRYAESLETSIGGIVAVAGFLMLHPDVFQNEAQRKLAESWLSCPINHQKIRERVNKIHAVFSDNDPYVPIENQILFQERLGAKTLVLSQMGHIGTPDMVEVPSILEQVLDISQDKL